MNARLPPGQRLRVLAGEPAIDWTTNPSAADRQRYNELRTETPVSRVREAVKAGSKALVVYGSGHVWHREGRITRTLEDGKAARVFVVDTIAPVTATRTGPESAALDDALGLLDKTISSRERPVLVSLAARPAGKLIANPFYLGQAMLAPDLTIGSLADAVVYFGREAGAAAFVP